MKYAIGITFRNMTPSRAIEEHLRERAAKLGKFCGRITSCRVIVEAPHRHSQKGKEFEVSIEISVPGRDIVINHVPKRTNADKLTRLEREGRRENHRLSKHDAHEDLYVAIRDAFNAAGRKL